MIVFCVSVHAMKSAINNNTKAMFTGSSRTLAVYLHVSFSVNDPDAGVVIWLFGSLSHVTAPLLMRMYLYWIVDEAGRLMVTSAMCECMQTEQT